MPNAKKTYLVLSPVKHGGEVRRPDDADPTIELSLKEAKPLLEVNAIGEINGEEPAGNNSKVIKMEKEKPAKPDDSKTNE